jgi:hypothetical protein
LAAGSNRKCSPIAGHIDRDQAHKKTSPVHLLSNWAHRVENRVTLCPKNTPLHGYINAHPRPIEGTTVRGKVHLKCV